MSTRITAAAFVLAAFLLTGCAVGPRYIEPPLTVPPAYKEAALVNGDLLQPADPRDHMSRQGWWDVFVDGD